jgi:hypothetical protein
VSRVTKLQKIYRAQREARLRRYNDLLRIYTNARWFRRRHRQSDRFSMITPGYDPLHHRILVP